MSIIRFVVRMFAVILIALDPSLVFGQNYPNKPIRIVTAEPGGSGDFLSRLIADKISGALGQPVIVENRPSGVIPGEIVSKSPPDGYTTLVYSSGFWITPLLQKIPYDPVKDFSPITLLARAPSILVVHPSVPVKSVNELIALAKAKPGALNYASSGTGGTHHLAAELFKSLTGVNIMGIPYKGAGPALNGVISGQVQLIFGSAASMIPHIKSSRLNALAVTSAQPSVQFPGLPTVAATVPGYESGSMYPMFTSAKTPTPIINRLNREVVRLLNTVEAKERLLSTGIEAVGSSPEELAAKMTSEMIRLSKVIKDANIRTD